MKQLILKSLIIALLFSAACRNKAKDTDDTKSHSTTDTAVSPSNRVEIAPDDTLKDAVRDATKDYPGVTATVENGEITLTGEITRDRLQKLMATLNSLQPKKINNQLTIK